MKGLSIVGKYSSITPNLPKLVNSRSELVEAKMAEFRHLPVSELIKKYAWFRKQKKELDEKEKALNILVEALVHLIIPIYEEQGVSSMKIADTGQTISVQEEPVAKVVDREVFRQWCVANDLEKSLQLHSSTTNALVKERLLAGEPEPPGVEAYTFSKVVLRNK
jgi:hypothetical protein